MKFFKRKPKGAAAEGKSDAEIEALLSDMSGLYATIKAGLQTRDEMRVKNRIIATLFVMLAVSGAGNLQAWRHKAEPKFVAFTPDGRMADIPAITKPIYSDKTILGWAAKCVQSIYRLSYVDWEQSLPNNTTCLSDKGRKNFKDSLEEVKLLNYLTPELQGNIWATVGIPSLRNSRIGEGGYTEWNITIPYRLNIDGRQRGTVDLVMIARVRRVSFTLRDDGLWVESYIIRPASSQGF